MTVDSSVNEKTGLFMRLKALPGKMKAGVVDTVERTKKLGQDDPRRIVHSLKVGLALTLVSSFFYFRPLYDGFGASGMWAVLTVVVIFEFTVGATLSKSMNRGFATFLAGALAIGAKYLASLCGEKGQPIVLGCFVFVLAAGATFSRFFPHIKKKYDYGVLIFILTFSLISVSGYQVDEILVIAHQRLSTILIGGATCIIISIFVCPVWAGEELQILIANNIGKLASFLEGFGGEYYELSKEGDNANAIKPDNKSFLPSYKSVLNSKGAEESMANFAWWEPRHGRFQFRHPLKQYLKIGSLTRECAYHIESLNGYLTCKLQSPAEFRAKIEDPCKKMSSESGKALKELSLALRTMTRPTTATNTHVENCKIAVQELNAALKAPSSFGAIFDFSEIQQDITVASLLVDLTKSVEKLSEAIHDVSKKAHFKDNAKRSIVALDHEKPPLMHRGVVAPVTTVDAGHDGSVRITIPENIGINPTDVKSIHT